LQALHRLRLEDTPQQEKHRACFNAKVGALYGSEAVSGLGRSDAISESRWKNIGRCDKFAVIETSAFGSNRQVGK
jgi:hypothetical protein